MHQQNLATYPKRQVQGIFPQFVKQHKVLSNPWSVFNQKIITKPNDHNMNLCLSSKGKHNPLQRSSQLGLKLPLSFSQRSCVIQGSQGQPCPGVWWREPGLPNSGQHPRDTFPGGIPVIFSLFPFILTKRFESSLGRTNIWKESWSLHPTPSTPKKRAKNNGRDLPCQLLNLIQGLSNQNGMKLPKEKTNRSVEQNII